MLTSPPACGLVRGDVEDGSSAGWTFVTALHEMHLRMMSVLDPSDLHVKMAAASSGGEDGRIL